MDNFVERWARKCQQQQIESQLPTAETPKEVKSKQKINTQAKLFADQNLNTPATGIYGLCFEDSL